MSTRNLIALAINGVGAFLALFSVMNTRAQAGRGTNAASRFVRDTSANMRYTLMGVFAVVLTLVSLFISGFTIWVCIPTLLVLILTFVFRFKSNSNKQRVKDARVVTKGTLEVGSGTAKVAGTAVGAYVGGDAGAKIGSAVGEVAGKGMSAAASNMTDVQALDLKPSDFEKLNNLDMTDFMQVIGKTGIPTDGKTSEELAQQVISCASDNGLKELPDNLSQMQKAYILAGGLRDK